MRRATFSKLYAKKFYIMSVDTQLLKIDSKRQNPERLAWIDAIKGVCIVCVVLYHVTLGLAEINILHKVYTLQYFWTYITVVATPPFFILSGYFIHTSLEKHGYSNYFINSLRFILFPYVLWSIIQVTIKIAFSGYVNKAAEFDLWKILILEPAGQFWFLHALFFAQCLFIIIHKLCNKHYFLLFLITACLSLCFYKYQTLSQDIRGLSLVLLGVFLSKSQVLLKIKGIFWLAIMLFLFIVSGLVYQNYLVPLGLQSASNFIGGIAVTMFFVNFFQVCPAPKTLILLGKHSMYIFLLHLLALVPFRILLVKIGISNAYVFITFLTVSGLFLPILFAALIEPFGLSRYLGIKAVNYVYFWRHRKMI